MKLSRKQDLIAVALAGLALAIADSTVSAQEKLDRTVLPIAEPKRPTYTELDARKAKAPARFEVKAPKGAPNAVIVLIDDIGFGGPTTFGGPIRTPTMDQLAQSGLRFNNFHTTALCSPTRVALKSGRNHHTANAGSIMETSTAFPGNTGQIPNSVAPLAEMLRLNGYSTGAFGKWHETAAWETSVSGPFDRWPTRQGFDKSTWSYETEELLSLEALRETARKLPASIYRCKGVVHTAEAPARRVILQVVGKRVDIAFGDEWNGRQPRTRIVVIGAPDGVDGSALREAFDRCRRRGARAGGAAPRHANA